MLCRYCGYEVTTEGDSFTIAFHDAFDAVCWSLAMQQAMLEAGMCCVKGLGSRVSRTRLGKGQAGLHVLGQTLGFFLCCLCLLGPWYTCS